MESAGGFNTSTSEGIREATSLSLSGKLLDFPFTLIARVKIATTPLQEECPMKTISVIIFVIMKISGAQKQKMQQRNIGLELK